MNQAKAPPMRMELAYESERCSEQRYGSKSLPQRHRVLPVDYGLHPDRADDVNTSDGSFNCTLIAATRHGRGFEQMNSQHERTQ